MSEEFGANSVLSWSHVRSLSCVILARLFAWRAKNPGSAPLSRFHAPPDLLRVLPDRVHELEVEGLEKPQPESGILRAPGKQTRENDSPEGGVFDRIRMTHYPRLPSVKRVVPPGV